MAAQAGQDGNAAAPEMALRIRDHDWTSTPLGPRSAWPQSLRTTADVMLASGHAMCLVWGSDLTLLYNDAYAPFLGARHPAALGESFASVWAEIWEDIGPLVERVFAGETVTLTDMPLLMTRNGFEEETWWTFSYSPVRGEQGEVAGLLDVAADSTPRVIAERERDLAQARLEERETFLSSVLSASTDCIKVVELDGSLSFMSEGGMGVMEIDDFNDVSGCPWPDFMKDAGVTLAQEALEAARQGRRSHFETEADTFKGTPKFWSVSVTPIFDADGAVERILSVSRDHTELEKAREQQKLLNAELGHRLKNVLAVVQSIASQTLRGASSLSEASDAFASRLASLGEAADVLTAGAWQSADLNAVIDAGLTSVETKRDRIRIEGPPIRLNGQAALAMTLALHELATNATKYGALSNEAGVVDLNWQVTEHPDEPRFTLLWRERGGPPVSPPDRRGFGSRMIERSLRSYFRGETQLSYPVEGLEFRIDAPLSGAGERTKA